MPNEMIRQKFYEDGSKLIGAMSQAGLQWMTDCELRLEELGYIKFWYLADGTPYMAQKPGN